MLRGLNVDRTTPVPDSFKHTYLTDGHWIRRGVWDDGSCFYHSLACVVNYQPEGLPPYHEASRDTKKTIGRKLREDVRRSLSEKVWVSICRSYGLEGVAPNYTKLCDELRGHKTWANYWTILLTFHMLHLNVVFYDMAKGGKPYCGVTNVSPEKEDPRLLSSCASKLPDMNWRVCCILWLSHSHFEPIGFETDAGVQFHFAPGEGIGKSVIERYLEAGECPLPKTAVLHVATVNRVESDAFDETPKIALQTMRMQHYVESQTSPFQKLWRSHCPLHTYC